MSDSNAAFKEGISDQNLDSSEDVYITSSKELTNDINIIENEFKTSEVKETESEHSEKRIDVNVQSKDASEEYDYTTSLMQSSIYHDSKSTKH